ncbi:ABC transporter G family member 3 [Hibiscus syriacus]|uniref:ABC transporter G family member 3 n=1 Tax=Hibiscus syriacus TaxID=106335 RepID=A0A6A2ZBI6_HIBSY|nr:ABC transporter G family member 3 [Hibiscus syriacus]
MMASVHSFGFSEHGALGQSISFEDSPEWEDTDVDVRVEEGGDSINAATTPVSPSLSKLNSGSLPSPHLPEGAAAGRKIARASVAWKDSTVTIKGKRKYSDNVVKSSSGYALPGTMTVIMGPAKSGKFTLLRAIAGRLPSVAKMYGEIFVNGVKMHMPYGSYKKNVAEEAIHSMSLGDFANKLIGGHCYMKGLPSECLLADCVSALLMMVTLKKLTSTGCTLVFILNQSSTEVFGLFDRICLLSNGNTLFFGETLACLQHFSNAGFPCPIMQSPSDHFLRAINTDFDRIIAVCKNWKDDNGEFSSVNMDTSVAICTLEATYKSSADAAAVETMIQRLTEKEGPLLKSKGKAGNATRIAVLTWRSLLIMSREWRYYWLRLILYMLLALCIGSIFSGLGHSLSSVVARVAAIFVFVSFTSLLSIAGVPALIKEIKIYVSEESNQHSGALVFLFGQLLSSIPFLFLISISRLMLAVASLWKNVFRSVLTLVTIHVLLMLAAGYFRIRNELPGTVWTYPLSYIVFHSYSIQGLLENEYPGVNFAIGQVRTISGFQALHSAYDISPSSSSKLELDIEFLCLLCYIFMQGKMYPYIEFASVVVIR